MEMQKSENKDTRVPLAENVREYDERRYMGRRTRKAAKQSTPGVLTEPKTGRHGGRAENRYEGGCGIYCGHLLQLYLQGI